MRLPQVSDFDYHLPPELVAQVPAARRQDSRLMVIDRQSGRIENKTFIDFKKYLSKGDGLVLNDTRVIPARIFGRKVPTQGRVEVLLVQTVNDYTWQVLLRPVRGLKPGSIIEFGEGLKAKLIFRNFTVTPQINSLACGEREQRGGGSRRADLMPSGSGQLHQLEFNKSKKEVLKLIKKIGFFPVPPYIKRKPEDGKLFKAMAELDRRRYQTVYASEDGAIAAPTAGLHFNRRILTQLETSGINILYLTLHVGYGTFRPVRQEDLKKKKIYPEFYRIPASSIRAINRIRNSGAKVTVVGTTTCRALETAALNSRLWKENSLDDNKDSIFIYPEKDLEGWTDLFIYPRFRFRVTDRLLTNFHLPGTSLLMLVAAFCGDKLWRQAYEQAIKQRYRFYSYGDAMLIC